MKKFALVVAMLALAIFVWAANPTEIVKTVSLTTVPEQLSTNELRYRAIVFVGNKAARTANVGRVWLQRNPTNDVGAIPLLPGQTMPYSAQTQGTSIADWWIDVENAGDGVVAVLIP